MRRQEAAPKPQLVADLPPFDPTTATFDYEPAESERSTVEFPPAIQAKADAVTSELRKQLTEASEAWSRRAGEVIWSNALPCRWRLLTHGPVRLDGDPPYKICRRLRSGEPALIIGISWADPGTPVPAQRYLAGKPYHAGFQAMNRSALKPGRSVELSGNFSADAVHLFPWLFTLKTQSSQSELFDVTFYVHLPIPGLDEAAFANWHSDPSLQWRQGPSNRFFVIPPPKLRKV